MYYARNTMLINDHAADVNVIVKFIKPVRDNKIRSTNLEYSINYFQTARITTLSISMQSIFIST